MSKHRLESEQATSEQIMSGVLKTQTVDPETRQAKTTERHYLPLADSDIAEMPTKERLEFLEKSRIAPLVEVFKREQQEAVQNEGIALSQSAIDLQAIIASI